MSWQVAAFTMLAAVIIAGAVWYERSRPSSRTVALVAALAALAVAGRLVLAPVPNVVATTDIALITGFALGGAPGFAVGALAAPVSNLWLGQGPWTPWQMAGWGLCGLLGAALAYMTHRRLGRFGLAFACAFAGLAYGAMLDLSVMVTFGGEQSLDRYLALSARGIPFNVAHAVGNFAIALAAGPALVRMISRFRQRSEFTWRPAAALPLAALAALTVVCAPPAPADAAGPSSARSYVERQQNPDGGWGASPTSSSNLDMTAWAMLGVEASGRNPLDLRQGGKTPLDFLSSHPATSTADLEKVILAVSGAGLNPRSFGGRDLVAALVGKRNASGSWGGFVDLTAFGVFALKAGGASSSQLGRSTQWLRSAQNPDGGWGFEPGSFSTPDSTGSALQAIALTGAGDAGRKGVAYLRRTQGSDGSFGGNSQGTAWAVQGLTAVGVNPAGVGSSGNSAFEYLAARQVSDGHYRYSASSDQTPVWVTSQALMAVEREAFPVEPVPRASQPGGLPAPEGGESDGGTGGGAPGSSSGSAATGPDAGNGAEAGRGDEGKGNRGSRPSQSSAGTADGPAGAELAAAVLAREEGGGADAAGENSAWSWALGALAALAAALGGGFFWYRRRLP